MTGFQGNSVILENLSEGHSAIEAGRFLAGEGVISMVADQGLFVKSVTFETLKIGQDKSTKVACWSKTVPLPQKKLYLAVLVTMPSLSWMGRQMWKI